MAHAAADALVFVLDPQRKEWVACFMLQGTHAQVEQDLERLSGCSFRFPSHPAERYKNQRLLPWSPSLSPGIFSELAPKTHRPTQDTRNPTAMSTKPRSDSATSASSTSSIDPYANSSVFRNSPNYKADQLDDLSHGSTAKARRWSGAKKNPGEGRSHFESRVTSSDQTKLNKEENKVSVKKNKDLPTRVKKNHAPEHAAKVYDATHRE